MFLTVTKKTVVDSPLIEAVEPDLGHDDPVEAQPEIPAVTHQEIELCYVETDVETVAENIALKRDIEHFEITFDDKLKPTLGKLVKTAPK